MTLRIIDISNWQAGLDINAVKSKIDGVICKCTEGTYFVDKYCDNWITQAQALNMPFGFYHFANSNDAISEADYFIKHGKGYFNKGIPILDLESNNVGNWTNYANKWCKRVHDVTGVWPMVYTSAGFLGNLSGFKYVEKCGLWVAGYPYPQTEWINASCPYNVDPWEFAAMWQFTSSLKLNGYSGRLDGSIAYMNVKQWNKYAGKSADKETDKDTDKDADKQLKELYVVAFEVIQNKWGKGITRKRKLTKAGYDYAKVQAYVNDLYSKANKVIHGDYGTGKEREKRLGKDYQAVQYIVNDILS